MKVYTVKKSRTKRRDAITGKIIPVGSTVYWWKFREIGKQYSATYPRRQDLTRSEFLKTFYDIADQVEAWDEDLQPESIDEILDQIETLKEETEESLEAMPEQLQETSSAGELLQERIEELENWHSDLDNTKDGFEPEWNSLKFRFPWPGDLPMDEPNVAEDDLLWVRWDVVMTEKKEFEENQEEMEDARESWLDELKQLTPEF